MPNFKVWERDLFEFTQAGYTADDLRCVLIWIMRENKKRDFQRSNSLKKLLGDEFRTFDSYLTEARAIERNHKPASPKAEALKSFRGFSEADTAVCARRVGEVLNGIASNLKA